MVYKNHHTVHTGKTEAMIISNTYFVGPLQPVMFGNNMIKYVTESTCLGSQNRQQTKVEKSSYKSDK